MTAAAFREDPADPRRAEKPILWRHGNDLFLLSEVVAVCAFSNGCVEVHLKTGAKIACYWQKNPESAERFAKSLNDALEAHWRGL